MAGCFLHAARPRREERLWPGGAGLFGIHAHPGDAGYPRRLANYYPDFNSTQNMRQVTKWAKPLTMGQALPELMRWALFQLRNSRSGPVLIEAPVDVFGADVPEN